MACREFSLWYNTRLSARDALLAMACREFSLWYNYCPRLQRDRQAMACREFSLWYNPRFRIEKTDGLWLVGNSRYGTMTGVKGAR